MLECLTSIYINNDRKELSKSGALLLPNRVSDAFTNIISINKYSCVVYTCGHPIPTRGLVQNLLSNVPSLNSNVVCFICIALVDS